MQRIKSQSDFHLHGKNRYLVINQPMKLKPSQQFDLLRVGANSNKTFSYGSEYGSSSSGAGAGERLKDVFNKSFRSSDNHHHHHQHHTVSISNLSVKNQAYKNQQDSNRMVFYYL
jgi:hypothetical protein